MRKLISVGHCAHCRDQRRSKRRAFSAIACARDADGPRSYARTYRCSHYSPFDISLPPSSFLLFNLFVSLSLGFRIFSGYFSINLPYPAAGVSRNESTTPSFWRTLHYQARPEQPAYPCDAMRVLRFPSPFIGLFIYSIYCAE
jgi:hypothetical protein